MNHANEVDATKSNPPSSFLYVDMSKKKKIIIIIIIINKR